MATKPNPPVVPAVSSQTAPRAAGEASAGIPLGLSLATVFYASAWAFPYAPIERYFLGHPVAIAATVLFGIACGILLVKSFQLATENRLGEGLRDEDLGPAPASLSSTASRGHAERDLPSSPRGDRSPSEAWVMRHDAGRVSARWLTALEELPETARQSRLVGRLTELLNRQSGRTSTRHLSDDQREISSRELDAAHDSLQLVRIIVWAIPMLGFLGTVIGITQTLGGLDFTDGTAAVDRLKGGLYVAFDTTAIGLVLSVIAIFLQFPVERREQKLLGEIDRRVGSLLARHLPSDDAADHPAGQIAQLCDGIRVAVAESLSSQAALWRQTIDEAHSHWQRVAADHGDRIGAAILDSLAPELRQHSTSLRDHSRSLEAYVHSLAEVHRHELSDLDHRFDRWMGAMADNSRVLVSHQQAIAHQTERLTDAGGVTENLVRLQASLDTNLLRLVEAQTAAEKAVREQGTRGMADAMRVLARAVDVLAGQMPPKPANTPSTGSDRIEANADSTASGSSLRSSSDSLAGSRRRAA